jgi:RHS repeat-associated protein
VSSNLVRTTGAGGDQVYVYDASGQRVAKIQVADAAHNILGAATGYLGSTELTDANTAVNHTSDSELVEAGFITGTRYYAFGGATVAVRQVSAAVAPAPETSTLSLMFGDEQGSATVMMEVTLDATGAMNPASVTDPIARNAYTPYGAVRGTGTPAENDKLSISKGWLNQVSDQASTGLVYLNARYFDPLTSRFISPDPLMNPMDPKTLDAYMYADNNPVAFTDASGLGPVCTGLSGTALSNCQAYGNTTANYMTGTKMTSQAGTTHPVNAKATAKSTNGGRCSNYACVVDNLKAQGAYNPGTFVNVQAVTNGGNLDWVDVSNSPPVTNTEHARALIGTAVVILALCLIFKPVCAAEGAVIYAGAEATDAAGTAVKVGADELLAGTVGAADALPASSIRFSQSSVNGAAEIEASMRNSGWVGDAIDVVRMPDGGLTSLDNTRLLAASRAGIDVQARVHGFDDALPYSLVERFTTPKGGVPSTWGDAVINRIGGQSAGYRTTNPLGSWVTGWSGN